ncbi:hypothetical protein RyT2_26470 [Pseudolactococcus yaeyamensis]
MRRFRVEPEYYEDYQEIISFMNQNEYSERYIAEFKKETRQAMDYLEINNEAGSLYDSDSGFPYRKFVYFKHLIIYVLFDEEIRILRLFHEKQDWQNKL